jgi:hypothetical protein
MIMSWYADAGLGGAMPVPIGHHEVALLVSPPKSQDVAPVAIAPWLKIDTG